MSSSQTQDGTFGSKTGDRIHVQAVAAATSLNAANNPRNQLSLLIAYADNLMNRKGFFPKLIGGLIQGFLVNVHTSVFPK